MLMHVLHQSHNIPIQLLFHPLHFILCTTHLTLPPIPKGILSTIPLPSTVNILYSGTKTYVCIKNFSACSKSSKARFFLFCGKQFFFFRRWIRNHQSSHYTLCCKVLNTYYCLQTKWSIFSHLTTHSIH